MKKFRSYLIFCLTVCLCFCMSAVFAFADYDRFGETEYYFDVDASGWGDYVYYSVSLDFEETQARINYYESEVYDVVIPESFTYDGEEFTVVEIAGGDAYNEWQNSVEIPATVTTIAPESIGYCWQEIEIDNSYMDEYGYWVEEWDYEERLMPIDGFTIKCCEGSAAEAYAIENGFNCVTYKSLKDAVIAFAEDTFTYTGRAIEPTVAVLLNENSLVENVDFYLSYSSNVAAGTGMVTVNGLGQYRGTLSADFTILPADVSKVSFNKVASQYYSGKSLTPAVNAAFGDLKLRKNIDYTAEYSNNTEPGTGKITVKLMGNYKGTKTLSFKISMKPISNLKTTVTSSDQVKLSWSNIPCDEYRVYVYNSTKKKYVTLKKTTDNTCVHTGRKQLTTYKYAVKAIVYGEKKNYQNTTVYISATTEPVAPKISLTTKNKAVVVKWNKNSKADGYQIFRMTNWDYEYTRVKTIKDKNTTSWTNKGLSNDNDYYYVVRAFKKVGGKYIYSDYSEQKYSGSSASRLNGATLKSRTSYKVYNTQGKTTYLAWTETLSKNDIKILEKFAKKHFTADMSREEVLQTTLNWINRNVTYASGDLWYDISGMSYVEAIFAEKKGQCVQYNGAMAAMMTYLGYNVRLIQGYRYSSYTGSTWQHFWVEAVISGNTYVFETGNYGRDGSWSYMCKKYSETMGYMKNGKKL